MRIISMIARGLLCPLFAVFCLSSEAASTPTMTVYPQMTQDKRFGSFSPTNVVKLTSGSHTVTATPNPGYRFNIWQVYFRDRNGGFTYATANTPVYTVKYDKNLSQVELVANFAYATYSVTFDANGGTTPSEDSREVLNELNATWPAMPTTTRTGHTFAGWYDGDTQVRQGDALWLTQNLTLKAKWTPNKYKLSVKRPPNGGISKIHYKSDADENYLWTQSDLEYSVAYGTGFSWYAEPAPGYVTEWNSTNPCNGTMTETGASYEITVDRAVYTITFDPGSGMCSETNRTIRYGDYIGKLPDAYLDAEHEFAGWWDSKSGGTAIGTTTRYEWPMDVTFYAQWQDAKSFLITTLVEPEDAGTCTGGGQYFINKSATLTATPNAGYSFASWDDGVLSAERTVTVTKGMTYVANFTGNVYRVDFNVVRAEATVDPEGKSVTFGSPYGELPKPVCEDYQFDGWFATGVGGEALEESDIVNTTGKEGVITLNAHWTKLPMYHIQFDGNGADGGETMPNQKILTGAWAYLMSNAYTRVGYTYQGWTNVNGKAYADGERVRNLANDGETVVLFAKWQPNDYTINFNSNGQRGTMEPVSCTYDQSFALPANAFVNFTGEFLGWSTNAAAMVTEWDDEETVKNLATNGTVTLYAVWKSLVNDLMIAAHAKNLVLSSVQSSDNTDPFVPYDDGAGNTAVKNDGGMLPEEYIVSSVLSTAVKGPGTLSFCWKTGSSESYQLYVDSGKGPGQNPLSDLPYTSVGDGWKLVTYDLSDDKTYEISWESWRNKACDPLLLDQIIWTPAGDNPVPTASDGPTVGSVSLTSAGFGISFVSDARFDYRVLSVDSLTPPIDWQPAADVELQSGTGKAMTFTVPASDVSGKPQRFFKVEVLQRETK